jgi:hypothetical protein
MIFMIFHGVLGGKLDRNTSWEVWEVKGQITSQIRSQSCFLRRGIYRDVRIIYICRIMLSGEGLVMCIYSIEWFWNDILEWYFGMILRWCWDDFAIWGWGLLDNYEKTIPIWGKSCDNAGLLCASMQSSVKPIISESI